MVAMKMMMMRMMMMLLRAAATAPTALADSTVVQQMTTTKSRRQTPLAPLLVRWPSSRPIRQPSSEEMAGAAIDEETPTEIEASSQLMQLIWEF